MNHFILHLPGMVTKKDGSYTNILELLGVTAEPLDVENDGRGMTVSAVMIDGKQYPLADILARISGSLSGGLNVKITGTGASGDPFKADHTFAEMKKEQPLTITLNGTPATEIAYTKSSGNITKITAKFVSFGAGNMTVTELEINGSGITKTETTYALTEET